MGGGRSSPAASNRCRESGVVHTLTSGLPGSRRASLGGDASPVAYDEGGGVHHQRAVRRTHRARHRRRRSPADGAMERGGRPGHRACEIGVMMTVRDYGADMMSVVHASEPHVHIDHVEYGTLAGIDCAVVRGTADAFAVVAMCAALGVNRVVVLGSVPIGDDHLATRSMSCWARSEWRESRNRDDCAQRVRHRSPSPTRFRMRAAGSIRCPRRLAQGRCRTNST